MVLLNSEDTIVARATPLGKGGIGVIRISGSKSIFIAERLLKRIPKPRVSEYLPFLDKNGIMLDQGIALFFKGPHSFTGEDVLELHGHGGLAVMECIIQEILSLGVRLAMPGEFSLRAFLNNKIDLVQAEAIADLINANSEQAARSAVRSLTGDFSNTIESLVRDVIKLRVFIEASLDFPEEDLEFLGKERVQKDLANLKNTLDAIIEKAKLGRLLTEGVKVVLSGPPNAGKSTLLNCLSGQDVAIVTEVPGTTRDVLREHINIDGLVLQFIDTAGLRESEDVVEQEGIRRALQEIKMADHIVLLIDGAKTKETNPFVLYPEWMEKIPNDNIIVLYNKIDVVQEKPSIEVKEGYTVVRLSAKTGEGIQEFREYLKKICGFTTAVDGLFTARARHLEALKQAKQCVETAVLESKFHLELVAENLRLAQIALGEVTGKFTSDDLLGKIFSEFCIGK